jgi:predicted nuclease with TOPRIM domain
MADLEQKLKESEKEKEELQMRVARLEGEVEVLRGLLRPATAK